MHDEEIYFYKRRRIDLLGRQSIEEGGRCNSNRYNVTSDLCVSVLLTEQQHAIFLAWKSSDSRGEMSV